MAVDVLTTHEGPIKERLVRACHEGFVFIPWNVLPGEIKANYDGIKKRVTVEKHSEEEGLLLQSKTSRRRKVMRLLHGCEI